MCRCGGWLYLAQPEKVVPTPVPLQAVHVEATLLDHCAKVEIRQTFANQEDTPIEAVYQFPLSEANTVCGLFAEIDGRKVTGVCKRKEDALADYDDAIATGYGAYTLSQSDKEDMLTLNVGNLPPKAMVVVTIAYVTELQFHNGEAAWILQSSSREQTQFFKKKVTYNIPSISITANLDMTNEIETVSCSSHDIDYKPGDTPNNGIAMLVQQSDQQKLDKDFILHLKVKESGEPIGRLEEDANGKLCALVAIQPKLDWPEGELPNSELIVVVDRSASMAGKRIAQVRDSLQLLLRSLPEGMLFNIVGFGSTVDSLFKDGSKEYSLDTFHEATKFIADMKANLGGTDVMKVLQKVAKDEPGPGQLRQILFITDGQVFNTSECIAFVAEQSRHTRVFTFGIGSDASEELVRGMARAGNGLPEFITVTAPLMEAKIMRQMDRILLPAITDLHMDWGSAIVERVTTTQSHPLFSGDRRAVYAVIDMAGQKEVIVTLRGQLGKQPWETKVKLFHIQKGSTLHALTAKKLIQELELLDDLVNLEENIVELSEKYSVLSRYTTFVAVEERDEATEGTMQLRKVEAQVSADSEDALAEPVLYPPPVPHGDYPKLLSYETNLQAFTLQKAKKGGIRLGLPSWPFSSAPTSAISQQTSASSSSAISLHDEITPEKNKLQDRKQAKKIAQERHKAVGMMKKTMEENLLKKKELQRSLATRGKRRTQPQFVATSDRLLNGGAGSADQSGKGKQKEDERKDVQIEDEDSESDDDITADTERVIKPSTATSTATHIPEISAVMKELVFAQGFDGSWTPAGLLPLLSSGLSEKEFKETLSNVLPNASKRKNAGAKSPRSKGEQGTGSEAWATAIALALLREKYSDQEVYWKLLAKKAMKWLQKEAQSLGLSSDSLLKEASKVVRKSF